MSGAQLEFRMCRSQENGRAGVNVPAIRMVDAPNGLLAIEWIDGQSVRQLLPGGAEEEFEDDPAEEHEDAIVDQDPLAAYGLPKGMRRSIHSHSGV